MNKAIMKSLGFEEEVKLVEEVKCPFCKMPIKVSDFKDQLSIKEYRISGLCQSCQDEVFNG